MLEKSESQKGPRKVKDWDTYFIDIADMVATRSKDPSTQVGAVLVNNKRIVSTGYNGFPDWADDDDPANWERPKKYELIIHAEINAIMYTQQEYAYDLRHHTLYCTLCPCFDCACSIVNLGVTKVVYKSDDNPRFQESFKKAKDLFASCDVQCEKLNGLG